MLLYRTLDFNHSAIQQQSALLALNMNLVHSADVLATTLIDHTMLENEVPTLKNFLTAFNFDLVRASFSVLREQGDTGIYLEQTRPRARIEIPVIGCEYSYTAYYSAKVLGHRQSNSRQTLWTYDPGTATELDRFTLTRPTVVNVKVPCRTCITRVHVRRISLVLDVGAAAGQLLD